MTSSIPPVPSLQLPSATGQTYPHVVAMIHVHSTTALLAHSHTQLLHIQPPSAEETEVINGVLKGLRELQAQWDRDYPIVAQVTGNLSRLRSFGCLMAHGGSASGAEVELLLQTFLTLPFIQALTSRALSETEIYVRNGIQCVEVENVGAPYFLGSGDCPWEEVLCVYAVARAIRQKYPSLVMGVHILSCNELEALPIAIATGCWFVRSEATLFHGTRPEGETENKGNLARFFYLRRVLRQLVRAPAADQAYPMLWSDVLKKHTVFPPHLTSLDTWLHNIVFAKLEGIIVTGAETGSDVDENSLRASREAIDKTKKWLAATYPGEDLPILPLITGSGLAFDTYRKYADFMIVGTALKRRQYWENEVDEENVQKLMAHLKEAGSR